MPKNLESISFLPDGNWVLTKDKTKLVDPKPIGPPCSGYCAYADGPNEKEVQAMIRSFLKARKGRKERIYHQANAYSSHFAFGPVLIQLYKI